LGDAWNDSTADAWGWAFGVISKTMADAGEKAKYQQELASKNVVVNVADNAKLSETRKSLVQSTCKTVADSLSAKATKLFYERLFEQHPSVVPLFKGGDMDLQADQLYKAISMAVDALDCMDDLALKLQELGASVRSLFQ